MIAERSPEWLRQRHRRVLRVLRMFFGVQIFFSVGVAAALDLTRGLPLSWLGIATGLLVGVLLLPKARRLLGWLYIPSLLGVDILHVTTLLWETPTALLASGSLWALAYIPVLVAAGRWWSYTGGAVTLALVLLVDGAVLLARLDPLVALHVWAFQAVTASLGTWGAALAEARTRRDLLRQEQLALSNTHLQRARSLAEQTAIRLTQVGEQLHSLDEAFPEDPLAARRHLAEATTTVRQTLVSLQRGLRSLGPSPLQQRTLPELVAQELRRLEQEQDLHALFRCDAHLPPLSPAVEDFLLQAARETLLNVDQHAQASRVAVELHGESAFVVLEVRDNGIGFDALPSAGESALVSLQLRAEQLGGTMTIGGEDGTVVTFRMPTSATDAILQVQR